MRTVLVVNPRSADGTTGRDWGRIRRHLEAAFPDAEERFTRAPRDATRATREALAAGFERVVAVGGDGTTSEVVNGFFQPGGGTVRPGAVLAVVPRGTGCDFARGLGLSKRPEVLVGQLAGLEPWPMDVGRLVLPGPGGAAQVHHFANITDFGLGGMVSERVNGSSKRFGGFVSFLWHTVVSLLWYRNQEMELVIDGGEVRRGFFRNVVVANGRYFGGGMHIAPGALLDDGLLDLVLLPDVGLWRSLRHTPALYGPRGLLDVPGVEYSRIRRIEARPARAEERIGIDMDGENPGHLPLSIEVVPSPLRLQAPRPEA